MILFVLRVAAEPGMEFDGFREVRIDELAPHAAATAILATAFL